MLGARRLAFAILCSVLGACGEGPAGPTCIDEDADGFGDECAAGPDCDDSDPLVHPGAAETCEGTDEDCDGATDTGCACEVGASRECGSDEGACVAGMQTCEDGAWGACVGASAPGEEVCDGSEDEDCDELIDEGCACIDDATRPCGSDVGACETGVETCAAGAWSACEGAVEPITEACDGVVDESCDGTVDEGCSCTTGDVRACGSDVGACALGTQTCADGTWSVCGGGVEPITEACGNGSDDDCDGDADEGCGPCPVLTVSCAAGCCAVPEAQIVANGHWPSLAIDSAGRIFVSYTLATSASRTARIAIYDPATATWADRHLGQGGDRSVVRIGAGDRVHVLHGTDPAWAMSGPNMLYQRSDDHGATFTPVGSIGLLEIGGTLDLAIDSADRPHVAFDGSVSGSSALVYAHHDGTSWSTQRLDPTSGSIDHPRIALGFADRPSIVYEARVLGAPPSGSAVRQVFFDGSSWVARDVDAGAYYSETDVRFAAYDHEVDGDDSARLLYARRTGTVTELVLASRTAGPTGTWTPTALSGASHLGNARLGRTASGAPFAISNGLALHREGVGGAWTTTPTGPAGTEPAIARLGSAVYVVYTGARPGATHPLLLTRIDL